MKKKSAFILILIFLLTFPALSEYVKIKGSRLYYNTLGKGDVLLLLHSGLDSSEVFKPVVDSLAEDFRILLIDTRGHGRSEDRNEPFTYSSFTEDVIYLLNHLGIKTFNAMGYSDGGVVAYHLAAKYPARVKKIVASGANYRVKGMTTDTIKWVKESLKPDIIRKNFGVIHKGYVSLSPHPDKYESFINKSRDLWLRDPYLSEADMESIKVPALIVAGDRDIITLEHLCNIRDKIKKSQLCIIPDAGHNVIRSAPAVLVQIVKRFLKSN